MHCLAGCVFKELLAFNSGVFLKLECRFRLLLKLLTCEALQAGLAEENVCQQLQVQGVEEVGAAAVVGIVGMLVAIGITLVKLAILPAQASATEWCAVGRI